MKKYKQKTKRTQIKRIYFKIGGWFESTGFIKLDETIGFYSFCMNGISLYDILIYPYPET